MPYDLRQVLEGVQEWVFWLGLGAGCIMVGVAYGWISTELAIVIWRAW